ncbi:MAG: choice-of-anchor B family protein [Kangiellaceae bacterium]|nr:choice-of-anchor B family protein [Kangiellaceae bacterium]
MNKFLLSVSLILSAFMPYSQLIAHAEHDKPRYVAENGVDNGRCAIATAPCKTISYAAQHSNKGDIIQIASGDYTIEDADTLFYLLSQTVPIKTNFSTKDNYAKSNSNNITRLSGVPLEYAEVLSDKGFVVIVDSKGQKTRADDGTMKVLSEKLDVYERLKQSQTETICFNGFAGDFGCNNIDLLAHVALSDFSNNPSAGNDIWGHYDLNDNNEYAVIGLSNGIGIVNVSNPTEPQVVTTIPSQPTSWRDLKVYQVYDTVANQWKSYAYVTADSASVGLLIIDLSNLPNSASVVTTDRTDLSAHNVYLSNVDYSTGVTLTGKQPYLHIAGSNRNGGAFKTYDLTDPQGIASHFIPVDATRSNYTHDVASMNITDARKNSQCVNGTDHCEVFFDFNENDFQLWDKTDNSQPARLSTTSYENAAYVHSGWYTEDKFTVIVHDELDEQQSGLNTTVRFFDLSNLTDPTPVATWTGPTRAIDHNGFVRGNRYYMSNYERGITVLDITNPSAPQETGFFDTYPLNNSASFNGAWGVYPFLPSGVILASDINSGLYVLRDNTLTTAEGSLSFNASNYPTSEGETVSIEVERSNGSVGNIKVAWEVATGSAQTNDFTLASGVLEWISGDNNSKIINVDILNDSLSEPEELLFVRLFNPENNATLISPNLATIKIAENAIGQAPTVSAGDDQTVPIETIVTLTATASDPDGQTLTYQWLQVSGMTVDLINEDTLSTSFTPMIGGSYQFEFTATNPQNNQTSDTVSVTATNSSNTPPTVNAGNDQNSTVNTAVNLMGTADDSEGDTLTFTWLQTSGSSVSLTSIDTLQTSFTTATAGTYSFELTASDGNSSSSASVNVTISEAPTPSSSSSGGGGLGIFGLLSLGAIFVFRRKILCNNHIH